MRYFVTGVFLLAGCTSPCCDDAPIRQPQRLPPYQEPTPAKKPEELQSVLVKPGDPAFDKKWGNKYDAQAAAETFVKAALKYPDDAEFDSTDTGPTDLIDGMHQWVIDGKVKAVNDLGGKHTHRYEVQVYYRDGVWHPAIIIIDGQRVHPSP